MSIEVHIILKTPALNKEGQTVKDLWVHFPGKFVPIVGDVIKLYALNDFQSYKVVDRIIHIEASGYLEDIEVIVNNIEYCQN